MNEPMVTMLMGSTQPLAALAARAGAGSLSSRAGGAAAGSRTGVAPVTSSRSSTVGNAAIAVMPLHLRARPLPERLFSLGEGLAAVSEPPLGTGLQAANITLTQRAAAASIGRGGPWWTQTP
jgi:hypothetical protein